MLDQETSQSMVVIEREKMNRERLVSTHIKCSKILLSSASSCQLQTSQTFYPNMILEVVHL